jgi:hypothetical protein
LHREIQHLVELRHEDTVSDLKIRENAKWLALLIDTEGAIGWTIRTIRSDRVNEEYRYAYRYASPYFSIGMSEKESKQTMETAGKLVGRTPTPSIYDGRSYLYTAAEAGRALAVIDAVEPYFDKFGRMAQLLKTLFKHHTYIPEDRFKKVVTTLFGKLLMPKEARDIIIEMTEREFEVLIQKAEAQTTLHLI